MPPAVAPAFRAWLKQSTNMKLSSDVAVTRITYEGITDFQSLRDFDKDTIESLPKACARTIPAIAADAANGITAEPEVPGANISTASVHRLVTAMYASKYYRDIGRDMTAANMHYGNILSGFKEDWMAYKVLKGQDSPDVPLIYD